MLFLRRHIWLLLFVLSFLESEKQKKFLFLMEHLKLSLPIPHFPPEHIHIPLSLPCLWPIWQGLPGFLFWSNKQCKLPCAPGLTAVCGQRKLYRRTRQAPQLQYTHTLKPISLVPLFLETISYSSQSSYARVYLHSWTSKFLRTVVILPKHLSFFLKISFLNLKTQPLF